MTNDISKQIDELQHVLYKLEAVIIACGHEMIDTPQTEGNADIGSLNDAAYDYVKQALSITDQIELNYADTNKQA